MGDLDDDAIYARDDDELLVTLRLRLPPDAPTTPACRFGVLVLRRGYVVYDRLLSRLVDGVYDSAGYALAAAAHYEACGTCPGDRAPTAQALGLLFPTRPRTC